MKSTNKLIVALIALFCIGNAGAYTWGFSNKTNETIDIEFGAQGIAGWYNQTVGPNKRVTFTPGGPLNRLHSFNWKKKAESQYKPGEITYIDSELANEKRRAINQMAGGPLGMVIEAARGQCETGCEFMIIKGDNEKIMFVAEKQ